MRETYCKKNLDSSVIQQTRIGVLQQRLKEHDKQLKETIPETFKEINERIIAIEKHIKLKRSFIFDKREKLK